MKKAAAFILLVLVSGLSSCSGREDSWHDKDISGLMAPLEFQLTDENGLATNGKHYRGTIDLVFFGFSRCQKVWYRGQLRGVTKH